VNLTDDEWVAQTDGEMYSEQFPYSMWFIDEPEVGSQIMQSMDFGIGADSRVTPIATQETEPADFSYFRGVTLLRKIVRENACSRSHVLFIRPKSGISEGNLFQTKVVPVTRVWNLESRCTHETKTRYGNHADFLNDRFNVDMIEDICVLRSCADLPKLASSLSFDSMSFSDIPADLNETA
jgi:hypothetical protein